MSRSANRREPCHEPPPSPVYAVPSSRWLGEGHGSAARAEGQDKTSCTRLDRAPRHWFGHLLPDDRPGSVGSENARIFEKVTPTVSRVEEYPPGSPAEWLADGHVTCSIQCSGGKCDHRMVDVRLDTLPQDLTWSSIGRRLLCKECGAAGSVHIVPNWHDRDGHAVPFTKHWKT